MNFSNLPKHIQDGIINLQNDEVFQKRFATDKKMDQIEEMKSNKSDEYKSFQLVLGNPIIIEGHKVKNLTPSIWSFLWVIDSPFINYNKKVSELDVDIFFFLLQNGIGDGDTVRIASEAIRFTSRSLQISYTQAIGILSALVRISFKPLNLFPSVGSGSGKNDYDADWLTSLASTVHQVTGYSPDYIMNEMSLSTACYYFAQYKRMNGNDQIFRRSDEQILALEDLRACELVVDRLIQNKVIDESERDKWLKHFSTPPNDN